VTPAVKLKTEYSPGLIQTGALQEPGAGDIRVEVRVLVFGHPVPAVVPLVAGDVETAEEEETPLLGTANA